ncbi:tryptophan halogenase family protein [Catenovulum agarivorans]|uniref:tryptophan halogenase family protein n=1 Tax=Catenovulum agarivorans TaxID=1172192 RepID=UPI00031FECA2|nr:tryptophan halogenase family protein [Catenovulum agarivorans]
MNEHSSHVKSFCILGGGSAGWMTASMLQHVFPQYRICLVESPEIKTVGVGEGSTPALKSFFELLGINESEWMPQCDATYKNGIFFDKWSENQGYTNYFHAFPSIIDNHTLPLFMHNSTARVRGIGVNANPNDYFLTAKLARENKRPIAQESFPFEINYAYHFNSAKLADYLRIRAIANGVVHVQAEVVSSELSVTGDIAKLILDSGDSIVADVFFDCSGMASALIQKALNVQFSSYDKLLFNDSAVVAQTCNAKQNIGTQTISTAMKAGWKWQIPLTTRTGNGYVYSSRYVSDELAEDEFINSIAADSKIETKLLKFKLGRVNKHWHKNCVAVGLSQGFIEPLEATALYLIQQTVGKFIDYWQKGQESCEYQTKFNQEINFQFDGIRDYVALHYKLNSRTDTNYWQDSRGGWENMSDSVLQLVDCWKSGQSIVQKVKELKLDQHYPVSSWFTIFSGHGFYPPANKNVVAEQQKYDLNKLAEFIRRASLNFDSAQ